MFFRKEGSLLIGLANAVLICSIIWLGLAVIYLWATAG